MILEFKKSDFSNGVNVPVLEQELSDALIVGRITSLDETVTHISVIGGEDLNNVPDMDAIKSVMTDHDGSGLVDKGYAESDGESQTTSDNYQEKLKLTIPNMESGDYLILWSIESKTTSDGTPVEVQVQVDDTTIISEPENSVDVFASPSGFKKLNLSEGPHDFDIDFRSNQVGTNVKVRYARIRVRKI